MPTTSVIRLVGGPRGLDGSIHDLTLSPHDRADALGDRFVRAVRGTTATSLEGLQARCHDRATTEELAATWRVAVYAAGRERHRRARLYRHRATVGLRATRGELGRWRLAPDDAPAPSPMPRAPSPMPPAPSPMPPAPSPFALDSAEPTEPWPVLEEAIDRAARRFATVAALLPDGPLADRAGHCRHAVAACVADAARLCAVGTAMTPGAPAQVEALARQVVALLDTVEAATAALVDLHLEVGSAPRTIGDVAHLAVALSETTPYAVSL